MVTRAERAREIEDTVLSMQKQGQGVWSLHLFPYDSILTLSLAAIDGDNESQMWVKAICKVVAQIMKDRKGNKRSGLICLLCDNVLWKENFPAVITFLTANSGLRHENSLANGICYECFERHGDIKNLRKSVLDTYRERLMPGAREVSISSTPGHA